MEWDMTNSMIVKATGIWNAPMNVKAKMDEFELNMDEPQSLGGTNLGPNPMQVVTASVVGCAGITLAIVARQNNFNFANATFEAEGEIDLRGFMGAPGVCRHFCNFKGTFIVETEESNERLQEIAAIVEDRCPVFNLLHDAGVQAEIVWKKG